MKKTRRIFHSYTSRLALLYAVIFSASTLLLFSFFYLFTASYMTQQMDSTIRAEIQAITEQHAEEGVAGLARLIDARVQRQRAQAAGYSIYLLVDYNFQPVAGNLNQWPKRGTVNEGWWEFPLVINRESGETHIVRARIFRVPGGRFGLLVGRDIHQLTEAKRVILQALTWGIAVMVLLAFAGGLVLGRRTVRKIERINQTTRSIMQGDLSRRVPLTENNDDFDQVAENLNQMLDRIQRLMEDIRRVSDNIAHDLRTPLTRLRQNLEQARQEERSDPRTAAHLEESVKEADSLLRTFNALLRIARVESGQIKFGKSEVDFATLIADVAEFYEPLAEEKNQTLSGDLHCASGEVTSWGDRDLLFQALANLLENAIKYTPRDGNIRIALQGDSEKVELGVADDGPGIPEGERENVFRRFYRLDQSRGSGGNGLGLSMVAAVVHMHDGEIELGDNEPGLRAVIVLPRVDGTGARISAS